MHSIETKNKFLELRAKGVSLAGIAKKIGVSERTLAEWNHAHAEELRSLHAIELEALHEKLLATREHELKWMTRMLRNAEETLLERELKYQSTGDVWRILTYLRAELHKRRIEPAQVLAATTPQLKFRPEKNEEQTKTLQDQMANEAELSPRPAQSQASLPLPNLPLKTLEQPEAPTTSGIAPLKSEQLDEYTRPAI